eukprot:TRINITY_DN90761_c0_g1_i1.p1 TRINITY_DN90761_c0_g1~~TRINITY_DN90761_c0_g1_i1.p1  ORF type:complete len:391 (-),score=140.73 TRINITY_DN90761_c0_g1_i1:197-1369(-)
MGNLCERRAIEEEEAAAHRKRGNELFKKQDYVKAKQAYDEAIKCMPLDASLYVNRCIAYRQLELWQKSADDAKEALKLQPGNEKAHYGLAFSLKRLKKLDEAMQACKKGLEYDDENKPLLDLKVQLEAALKEAKKNAPKAEAKPKPAAAKPKPKTDAAPAKKKDYNVDYSKWKDIGSDDEPEEAAPGDETIMIGPGTNPTYNVRNYAVEEMMKVMRHGREEMQKEFGKQGQEHFPEMGAMAEGPKIATKNLPDDYRKLVGTMKQADLAKFNNTSPRMLISLYGDIFDVSNRVDLYGSGKKKAWPGNDITWAMIIGEENEEDLTKYFNLYYDIFKVEEKKLEQYLRVVCHYLVQMEGDHGKPVGRLEEYSRERDFPHPTDELCNKESCKQQ